MTGGTRSGREGTLAGWTRMGVLAIAILAVDQATKAIVRAALARGESIEVVLGFQVVNVRNRGIAFGLLEDAGPLLIVVTVATLAILVGWFATNPSRRGAWIAIGLLVGGAVGNLIDRLREGQVTDFVDLSAWPAFNVADVAITAGVVVLMALVVTSDRPSDPGRRGEG